MTCVTWKIIALWLIFALCLGTEVNAAGRDQNRYFLVEMLNAQGQKPPVPVTQFVLNDVPSAGVREEAGDIETAFGFGYERGTRRRHGDAELRQGMAVTVRSGLAVRSRTQYAQTVTGGGRIVSASGNADATAYVQSTAFLVRATYELDQMRLRPWLGVGIGLAYNRVGRFEINYDAEMIQTAPGQINIGEISNATQFVARKSMFSPTMELSAGISQPLRSGWAVNLGYRVSLLGAYRLAGNGDGPAELTLNGDKLDIFFGGRRDFLISHDVTLSLIHRY